MVPTERQVLASLDTDIIEVEGGADDRLSAELCDADAIMVVSARLPAALIESLRRCRIISRLGTGVDKIDIDAATRKGIVVSNQPGAFTEEVADHTLALLLAVARQVKPMDRVTRTGRRPTDLGMFHRLSSQTVGLVGFGAIGRAVALRCRAFGLRVLVHDPHVAAEALAAARVVAADLQTLLGESDYVCMLCPLTPQTRAMIGPAQLRCMKPTAVLINTARGELVDEDALAVALEQGVIREAALDVFGFIDLFAADGFATDHPLFALDNVLLSPHVGAQSDQAIRDCCTRGAQAVVDVLSGRWPEYPVNPQVVPWFGIR